MLRSRRTKYAELCVLIFFLFDTPAARSRLFLEVEIVDRYREALSNPAFAREAMEPISTVTVYWGMVIVYG